MAQNVRAYCIADHCRIKSEETNLGDVEPSSFVLTLIVDVTESRQNLELELNIEWGVVGRSSTLNQEFLFRLKASVQILIGMNSRVDSLIA